MNNGKKVYVTMTDKFLSGWGRAEGKINKLVFVCDNLEEAERVANYARTRKEMKYINVTYNKPYYNNNRYLVQFKDKKDYPRWYEGGDE